ncbi:alpha/beta fold hydrolase [Gryllotalpicola ginsengisoli]|uniref:alpha/beta fold hydrolase n=1 Tax=Gryllotalpicola ginsengisoli TaxID=444608 RepID=UPI0003B41801|nr:alpha/beta hydrolase [Gryllotalpicola ginsengisoli]
MVTEADLTLPDGRILRVYDALTGTGRGDGAAGSPFPVFWLHGSPNLGSPPEPLFAAAEALGLRWVSYDRPGYGGSSPHEGRTVASAAADVAAIADALGLDSFAVLGHSGGGPHALACAALLPERVTAAVSVSAPAPIDADGLDWFAGWSPGIAAENRAAIQGRAALAAHWAAAEPEEMSAFFTDADVAALGGDWEWLAGVAGQAMEQGDEGQLEDTLAGVRPWGFRPEAIRVPVLIVHGETDRMVPPAHGRWLAAHCPTAELRLVADAGHITALDTAPEALAWLAARTRA